MQPSFRAVDQKVTEWQRFEKPENKRQMYGSQVWVDWLPYICLLFLGLTEHILITQNIFYNNDVKNSVNLLTEVLYWPFW